MRLSFEHGPIEDGAYHGAVTQHVLEDPGALSGRARRFLAPQGRRAVPVDRYQAWYVCTDLDGRQVAGPDGGLTRLERFFARFGGLAFGTERPAAGGEYRSTR